MEVQILEYFPNKDSPVFGGWEFKVAMAVRESGLLLYVKAGSNQSGWLLRAAAGDKVCGIRDYFSESTVPGGWIIAISIRDSSLTEFFKLNNWKAGNEPGLGIQMDESPQIYISYSFSFLVWKVRPKCIRGRSLIIWGRGAWCGFARTIFVPHRNGWLVAIFTGENSQTPSPPLSLHCKDRKFSPGFDSIPKCYCVSFGGECTPPEMLNFLGPYIVKICTDMIL